MKLELEQVRAMLRTYMRLAPPNLLQLWRCYFLLNRLLYLRIFIIKLELIKCDILNLPVMN
jgi:hypothetical protein